MTVVTFIVGFAVLFFTQLAPPTPVPTASSTTLLSPTPRTREYFPYGNRAVEVTWVDRFDIASSLISKAQYQACMDQGGNCDAPQYEGDLRKPPFTDPVIGISWEQAFTYCDQANGRLPTEEEWRLVASKLSNLGEKKYEWIDDQGSEKAVPLGDGINNTERRELSRDVGYSYVGFRCIFR